MRPGPPVLSGVKPERDPFQLRALPQEDVFFIARRSTTHDWCARRSASARRVLVSHWSGLRFCWLWRPAYWFPTWPARWAGYKLQALRVEERQLQDEKRTLEVEEAELLSPQRLEKLAQGQNLVAPLPGQVVRLNTKGDSAVAMVK